MLQSLFYITVVVVKLRQLKYVYKAVYITKLNWMLNFKIVEVGHLDSVLYSTWYAFIVILPSPLCSDGDVVFIKTSILDFVDRIFHYNYFKSRPQQH